MFNTSRTHPYRVAIEAFSALGYRVAPAPRGEEAIQTAFTAVLVDLNLGGRLVAAWMRPSRISYARRA